LASPIANAFAGVHGNSGSPSSEVNTGPYSVSHSTRFCSVTEPSAFLTSTLTSVGVICRGSPSTRYVVGEPGTSVSSNGVKRNAVETVWLHASPRVWPMSTTGTPKRLPPETSILPGIVRCAW
jgi:hypothetical protein